MISLINSLVSWSATPTKIWRIASRRHINCLLHVSIFSQKAAEKGMRVLRCFWKIFLNQEVNRSEYNPIIPLTLDLNIGKKKFLHHCCSPPLMKWTHSRNGNKLKSLTYSFILQKSEGIWKKKRSWKEGRKANESQLHVTAVLLRYHRLGFKYLPLNEIAKEFKAKHCEGWVHCYTWAIIDLHLQTWQKHYQKNKQPPKKSLLIAQKQDFFK